MNYFAGLYSATRIYSAWMRNIMSQFYRRQRHEEMDAYLKENLSMFLQKHGFDLCQVEVESASNHRFDGVYSGPDGLLVAERKVLGAGSIASAKGVVADAILQIRHFVAEQGPARQSKGLLAIMVSRPGSRIPEKLQEYISKYAPDVDWFLLDPIGRYRSKLGHHEENGSFRPLEALSQARRSQRPQNRLFAPKFQWLMKILILNGFDHRYWGGPHVVPLNVSELARIGNVSQPYASKFIAAAEDAGYVQRLAYGFAVQRLEELLEDWAAAVRFQARNIILPAASIYPVAEGEDHLDSLVSRIQKMSANLPDPQCPVISGQLACHMLGLEQSNVRSMIVYVPGDPEEFLRRMDLVVVSRAEAMVQVVSPVAQQSIFSGHCMVDGAPVADIIQCYLDVRWSAARGREQADFIWRKVLAPGFQKR
jgi:hypothetical protein